MTTTRLAEAATDTDTALPEQAELQRRAASVAAPERRPKAAQAAAQPLLAGAPDSTRVKGV